MKIRKGVLSIPPEGTGKSVMMKYTPSSDMLRKAKECDFMGVIQLCRLGKYNDMGKFIPIDLPDEYINHPETLYKTGTSDQEATEYYFIDEEYNTISPVYQTSYVSIINNKSLMENDYSQFLAALKVQTSDAQNKLEKSFGDLTLLAFEGPAEFEFIDAIDIEDEYDKELLVFVVTVSKGDIQVFDTYRWSVEKGRFDIELAGIPEAEVFPSRRNLQSCLDRYNSIIHEHGVEYPYIATFNDMI